MTTFGQGKNVLYYKFPQKVEGLRPYSDEKVY